MHLKTLPMSGTLVCEDTKNIQQILSYIQKSNTVSNLLPTDIQTLICKIDKI